MKLRLLIFVSLAFLACGPGLHYPLPKKFSDGSGGAGLTYNYFLYGTSPINGKIYGYKINTSTGALTAVPSTPTLPGGSSIRAAASIDGKYLYVANGSNILRYSIDASTGALTSLGTTATGGTTTNNIAIYPSGGWLVASFSGSASIQRFSINSSTGTLTSAGGTVVGNGPKFLTFHPFSDFLFVPNSTDDTISGFTFNSGTGAVTAMGGSPYAAGDAVEGLAVHPSGLFLYASNLNTDLISRFDINPSTGVLSGETTIAANADPWTISIHPGGSYLYTANGNGGAAVSGFSINSGTGALTALAGSPYTANSDTRSVAVEPTGKYVYYAGYSNNFIGRFTIGADGTLSARDTSTSTGADLIHDITIARVPQ